MRFPLGAWISRFRALAKPPAKKGTLVEPIVQGPIFRGLCNISILYDNSAISQHYHTPTLQIWASVCIVCLGGCVGEATNHDMGLMHWEATNKMWRLSAHLPGAIWLLLDCVFSRGSLVLHPSVLFSKFLASPAILLIVFSTYASARSSGQLGLGPSCPIVVHCHLLTYPISDYHSSTLLRSYSPSPHAHEYTS